MLPGTATSYWIETAPGTPYGALAEDVATDVLVVGAGIAGISTAWEAARAGARVVLVDAGRVAAGVTGHTTAKLSAQHTLVYAHVARAFGAESARLYAASQMAAVERVAQVSAELGIPCDLERVPACTWLESPDDLEVLADEVAAASAAGLDAGYVRDPGLPFPVAGALVVQGQAQFHPRRYLLGLVDDLVRRGGRVFEGTRAVELHEGSPVTVTTDAGHRITARDVVVATHYPVFDRAGLFGRLEARRELVVTAPLPVADDPGGAFITPEGGTRSVRTAPYRDGQRLLVVTGEHFTPGTGGVSARYGRLVAWMRERFPSAGEVVHRWAAQDTTSTDRVPFVGPLHVGTEHVHVATGFGGWGMSTGVMAGRLLAGAITGDPPPWAGLYDPRRLSLRREAAPVVRLGAKVAGHFVGDRLHRPGPSSPADIPHGMGAVVKVDGERCAVFRDDDGALHAVSARCTHLGCLVGFNDAERTWECPCHGSRFAVDGAVIQGPANRPLEPRRLPAP